MFCWNKHVCCLFINNAVHYGVCLFLPHSGEDIDYQTDPISVALTAEMNVSTSDTDALLQGAFVQCYGLCCL